MPAPHEGSPELQVGASAPAPGAAGAQPTVANGVASGGAQKDASGLSVVAQKLPDAIWVAGLLLPGFITERVASYFATFPPQSDAELLSAALAFTLVDVLLAIAVVSLLGVCIAAFRKPHAVGPRMGLFDSFKNERRRRQLLLLFVPVQVAVAVAVGMTWARLEESNVFFRLASSSRSSRADVWYTVFHENAVRGREDADQFMARVRSTCLDAKAPDGMTVFTVPKAVRYVRVLTTSGETYQGVPEQFSGDRSEKWVYLARAHVDVISKIGNDWTATCSKALLSGVLLNASQILSVEWIERDVAAASAPGQGSKDVVLMAGASYSCAWLRQQGSVGGTVNVAAYSMPACKARVPISVLAKEK